jgi:hypothetical protein
MNGTNGHTINFRKDIDGDGWVFDLPAGTFLASRNATGWALSLGYGMPVGRTDTDWNWDVLRDGFASRADAVRFAIRESDAMPAIDAAFDAMDPIIIRTR